MRGIRASIDRRGPAPMPWIVDAIRENRPIGPGDPIARGMPIFTP